MDAVVQLGEELVGIALEDKGQHRRGDQHRH